jgi:hypothetical protein
MTAPKIPGLDQRKVWTKYPIPAETRAGDKAVLVFCILAWVLLAWEMWK